MITMTTSTGVLFKHRYPPPPPLLHLGVYLQEASQEGRMRTSLPSSPPSKKSKKMDGRTRNTNAIAHKIVLGQSCSNHAASILQCSNTASLAFCINPTFSALPQPCCTMLYQRSSNHTVPMLCQHCPNHLIPILVQHSSNHLCRQHCFCHA